MSSASIGLIQVGRRPNIALQIMPDAQESTPAGHATPGAPITILRFRDRELPDVVYLAHPAGGLYPDDPQDIAHYAQVMRKHRLHCITVLCCHGKS